MDIKNIDETFPSPDYLYTATANVAVSSTSGWEKSAVAAV